jgi:pyruvate kinase
VLVRAAMSSTKIVCTLGPASNSAGIIDQLLEAGMSAARLNFSHGTHADHAKIIANIRQVSRKRQRFLPILADLQGPKIRIGHLVDGNPVELSPGETLRISTSRITGNRHTIWVNYPGLAHVLSKDNRILIDDGAIELRVVRVDNQNIITEVVHGGLLIENKGVNIPGLALRVPSLTRKDKVDLDFALEQEVDYIALSFVRTAQDIYKLKKRIAAAQSPAHVIAKIEKPQAIDNIDAILAVSDGVMIARGDLGVELSPWRVPVEQKNIIEKARLAKKPAITATQMLQSMIERPSPTRAEASDVANAVLDGSDALMLSGETAIGRHPVETVRMMSRIIETTETAAPLPNRVELQASSQGDDLSEAVARSATFLAENLGSKYIVVYTESGYTARLVSKYRPQCSVLGLSRHEAVCRRMKLLWGVRAKQLGQVDDLDALVAKTQAILLKSGWVKKGDLISVVAGTPFRVAGKTDLIKLHRIGESPSKKNTPTSKSFQQGTN